MLTRRIQTFNQKHGIAVNIVNVAIRISIRGQELDPVILTGIDTYPSVQR